HPAALPFCRGAAARPLPRQRPAAAPRAARAGADHDQQRPGAAPAGRTVAEGQLARLREGAAAGHEVQVRHARREPAARADPAPRPGGAPAPRAAARVARARAAPADDRRRPVRGVLGLTRQDHARGGSGQPVHELPRRGLGRAPEHAAGGPVRPAQPAGLALLGGRPAQHGAQERRLRRRGHLGRLRPLPEPPDGPGDAQRAGGHEGHRRLPSGGVSPQLQSIVVVDFGSQYTRLIARRLRELGVYSAIVGPDVTAADLAAHDPAGVILSGGPRSVSEPGAPGLPAGVLDMGLPVLAVCYGMQLVARERGGRVVSSGRGEYGKAVLKEYGGRLFEGVEGEFVAWMSHGDSVAEAPPGFVVTAVSESGVIAAMEDDAGLVYCLQFHPEVRHTPKGSRLLERFVERTGVPRDWTPENIVQRAVEEVRATVGDERVLLAVSGGVDSSTLALLLTRAIGDRLVPVFVDHGLLRLGEAEE